MRLDTRTPFTWRQINQLIKERLGSPNNVYLYRGLHHALFETLVGLHLRYSHKRKIVTDTGFGDHLFHAELELAKMGVRFKDSFEEDLDKEEKSVLAYVHDLDDAITGELYNHIETLKQVSSRKMFRIHLAHHLYGVRKDFVKTLGEFDIIIAALDKDYALVFTGEKVLLPFLTVSQLPWSVEVDAANAIKAMEQKVSLFQPEINQFESTLPGGVRAWFRDQNARRIYDRSVVVLKDHDGAAMLDMLNRFLNLEKGGLGEHNKVETPSLCRWDNEAWFKQAEAKGLGREQMQGTVILDGSLLNTAFANIFKDCLQQLDALSQ